MTTLALATLLGFILEAPPIVTTPLVGLHPPLAATSSVSITRTEADALALPTPTPEGR